jgi:hypothetical protein
MNLIIFTGPSLSVKEAMQELDATYLPPVAQGDVYRAAQQLLAQHAPDQPLAIGIIDGYFERVPAVWHKEILWAMSQGIHVFGSASMGALRAAELAAFGMEGIGRIYQDYAGGRLEDDDEVAVAHASADDNFTPLSIPMVDIRYSLEKALAEKIISRASHDRLIDAAKSLFYPLRFYPTIIKQGIKAGLPEVEMLSLQLWLVTNRVCQKRLDAIEMLRTMKARFSQSPGQPVAPKRVNYDFQETTIWAKAIEPIIEPVAETEIATIGEIQS